MKSTAQQLADRGFLEKDKEQNYLNLTQEQKNRLLQSPIPAERTLGARLLAYEKNKDAIEALITALKTEKKLYTKMAIGDALITLGKPAVSPLIREFGKIGTNQYQIIPEKTFGKKNYPLPRDIAVRILVRIGRPALPELLKALETNDPRQLSEIIDAIGFICFYDHDPACLQPLQKVYETHKQNDLIVWKYARALSAFPEASDLLRMLQEDHPDPRIQAEIKRSETLLRAMNN